MRLLLLLVFLAGFAACTTDEPPKPRDETTETIPFRKDGTLDLLLEGESVVHLDIEIADTDSSRMRGMMQRTSFPERSGMLFLFDQEEPQAFWMGNTPLALDLVFISADSQVVHVAKYTRPFSEAMIPSERPAQYVLEVPAGFADTYGINEDFRVTWERDYGK